MDCVKRASDGEAAFHYIIARMYAISMIYCWWYWPWSLGQRGVCTVKVLSPLSCCTFGKQVIFKGQGRMSLSVWVIHFWRLEVQDQSARRFGVWWRPDFWCLDKTPSCILRWIKGVRQFSEASLKILFTGHIIDSQSPHLLMPPH